MIKAFSKPMLILSVFIVMNGILIYKNIEKTKDNNILQEKIQYNEYSYGYTISNKFNKMSFIKTTDIEMGLQIILTDMGCKSCIEYYIKKINNFKTNILQYVHIYYVGINKEQLNKMGARFNYEHVPDNPEYYEILKTNQPIGVLCDKEKNVLLSDIALVMDRSNTDSFFNAVEKILSTLANAK